MLKLKTFDTASWSCERYVDCNRDVNGFKTIAFNSNFIPLSDKSNTHGTRLSGGKQRTGAFAETNLRWDSLHCLYSRLFRAWAMTKRGIHSVYFSINDRRHCGHSTLQYILLVSPAQYLRMAPYINLNVLEWKTERYKTKLDNTCIYKLVIVFIASVQFIAAKEADVGFSGRIRRISFTILMFVLFPYFFTISREKRCQPSVPLNSCKNEIFLQSLSWLCNIP